jgi:hypothetical protein
MTAKQFRDELKTLGVRRQWLADRLGVHWVTVGKWASGTLAVPAYASFALELLAALSMTKRQAILEKKD